jgi:acid phosphatase type 7
MTKLLLPFSRLAVVLSLGCSSTSGEGAEAWMGEGSTSSTTGTTTVATNATSGATSTSADDANDEGSSTGTVPDVGAPAEPLRVVVISDLNGSYGSTTYAQTVHDAVQVVLGLGADVVLSTGDMVAGQQAGLDYHAMWAGFHAAVSDHLAAHGLPFAITPGNHDASGYPSFALEREIFVEQWMPRKPAVEYVDDTHFPLRYSFVAGPALFVSLDSTTVGPLGADQMAWLEAQLEAGADMPVKIVYGHVPLVPFAIGRETEIIGDAALETMLEDHGVTLFISGHHHAYYPGRRGTVRYVSTSCLGSGPRALIGTSAPSPRSLLVLDLDPDGTITMLEALAEPSFDTPIARADLPVSLTHGSWTVMRDDGP